jgi:multisubunit Na+/H+ antiporter MnhB subunit
MYKMATSTPTQKVAAAALAGAIVTIVVFILDKLIPDLGLTEGVVAALTTITAFVISYFVPPSAQDSIVPVAPQSPPVQRGSSD